MTQETIGQAVAAMRNTKQLRHAGSYREGWEDAIDVWGQRLEAAMKTAPDRFSDFVTDQVGVNFEARYYDCLAALAAELGLDEGDEG